MAGIPFKACILGGAGGSVQVGVVARNYKNFREQLQTKYGLEKDFQVYLEDGTQVCDEEYFDVLEPQTKLTVVQRGVNRTSDANGTRGEKRLAPADSATSLPCKRLRLICGQPENDPKAVSAPTADPVVSSDSASLISCLRIASVSGNVNMRMSPPHAFQSPVSGSSSPPQQTQSPLRSLRSPPYQQQPPLQSVAATGLTTQFHVSGMQPLSHLPILTQEPCRQLYHQQQQLYHQQQQLQQQQLHHRQQQQQYPQAQEQPHLTSPPAAVSSPSVAYASGIHPQQTLTYHTVQRTPSQGGMQVFQGPYGYYRYQDNQSHLQTQTHPQPHQQMIMVSPPANQPQLVAPRVPLILPKPPGQLMLTHQLPSMPDMFQQKRPPLPPPLLCMSMTNSIQRRNSAPVAVSSSSSMVRVLRARSSIEHLTPGLSAQLHHLRQTTLATSTPRPQLPSHTRPQPVSGVTVLPIGKLSVVNCKDLTTSTSSTDDTDEEGSLCIVEKSSACSTPNIPLDTPPLPRAESPIFSFEASKSQNTPPIPPSQLATCMHTAPKEEAVKVVLQYNAESETSRNDDVNIESPSDIEVEDSSGHRFSASSPDDGYASSTSLGSLPDITSKLPFADFESSVKNFTATSLPVLKDTEHTPEEEETEVTGDVEAVHTDASGLPSLTDTSAPEAHEQFMKGEKWSKEPSLTVEGELDNTATVDTHLYHTLMQDSKEIVVIDIDDVHDSSPPAPPSPLLKLVVSVPIVCSKEGKIVCQGLAESLQTMATGEESYKLEVDGDEVRSAEEECARLVVSIPVCQLASGSIACQGFLAGRGEDNGDSSKKLKLQSGAKSQPMVNSEQEQAVQVQEYASEELVVTSCLHNNSCSHNNSHMRSKRRSKRRRYCTQADIAKAVNEIIANLGHGLADTHSVVNEQLLIVSEEKKLDENSGSDDGEKILLVSSDFGNEVVVSDEQDDDESESEVEIIMSSLAPHHEEIETEVVQMECLSEHYSEPINYTESNVTQDKLSTAAGGTEVQELSKKIEGLLELADLLTTVESKTIRDFFNGKPSDPRKGLQTYCLKNLSDNQAVFLEINFETRKWRGFVSQAP